MSPYDDLRKRKRELKEEIQVVEGLLRFSLRRFERYSPQQVLARTVMGLLKKFFFQTLRLLGKRMAGGGNDKESLHSDNGRADFWRSMSHHGLDLLLNYIESRRQEESDSPEMATREAD